MAFDKAAYWAQRGQRKDRGREVTMLLCTVCKLRPGWMRYGKKWVKVPGHFEKRDQRMVHIGCPGDKFLPAQAPETAPAAPPKPFALTDTLRATAAKLGIRFVEDGPAA